jgi:replication factor A1
VSQKSNIRTWSNARGEGTLFSVSLLDDSGEIKATAFKEEVNKFYDLLEVGKVRTVFSSSRLRVTVPV